MLLQVLATNLIDLWPAESLEAWLTTKECMSVTESCFLSTCIALEKGKRVARASEPLGSSAPIGAFGASRLRTRLFSFFPQALEQLHLLSSIQLFQWHFCHTSSSLLNSFLLSQNLCLFSLYHWDNYTAIQQVAGLISWILLIEGKLTHDVDQRKQVGSPLCSVPELPAPPRLFQLPRFCSSLKPYLSRPGDLQLGQQSPQIS